MKKWDFLSAKRRTKRADVSYVACFLEEDANKVVLHERRNEEYAMYCCMGDRRIGHTAYFHILKGEVVDDGRGRIVDRLWHFGRKFPGMPVF